jgi:hypothetical protein
VRRGLVFAVSSLLVVAAGGASACVLLDDARTPLPQVRDLARASDIVAIIRVDQIAWRTPEEEAEFHRLWDHPPMDTAFSYPAKSARFHVRRALKGRIPREAAIRNGATDCEVVLQEGADYVLFAMQPAEPGDRILPLEGTFRLDEAGYSASKLAELESSLLSTD